jgi:hypothetical protein
MQSIDIVNGSSVNDQFFANMNTMLPVFVAYHEAGHAVASCQLGFDVRTDHNRSHRYGRGKHVAQGGIPKDSLIPRLTLEPTYRQIALRMDATSPLPVIKRSDVSDVGDLSFFDAQMPN